MPLSRSLFTTRYGDLQRMLESTDEHRGYGSVTWKVGPHAGPKPYGDDHDVVFVNHSDIEGMAHPPEDHSAVERHANDIHQQMERGDVINVPHVQMRGGKFHIHPEHHGAIRAAKRRGAQKIPIVINKKDAHQAAFLPGGAEKPGDQQGLDKNYRWRWNGKGWYTKPSFNQGKCPPGMSANQGDRCVGAAGPVGGGPDPESMKKPEGGGAGGDDQAARPGDISDDPDSSYMQPGAPLAPLRRRGGAGGGGGRIARRRRPAAARGGGRGGPPQDMFAMLQQMLQMMRGGPPPRGPAQGSDRVFEPGERDGSIPYDAVDKHSVHRDRASGGGAGLDRRMFAPGFDPHEPRWKAAAKKSMKQIAQTAVDELRQKTKGRLSFDHRPVDEGGDYLGCGMSGCVYKGEDLPDHTPTVIKIDKGHNEGLMAQAMLDNPALGKLSSVPKYLESIPLDTREPHTNMELYAIHREDLAGLVKTREDNGYEHVLPGQPKEKMDLYHFFGSFGRSLGNIGSDHISMTASALKRQGIKPGSAQYKSAMDSAVKSAHEDWLSVRADHMRRAERMGPHVLEQYKRVAKDVDALVKHGVFPCDLHGLNWGMRESTGEVVMRDVGCAQFAH